ncbi:hypothetical protein E2C01_098370 [Portunus trituberculatus]|uniref:Uncharacterized protein n=1 Tax=Portunus trituberculatus TaxID=210409 RepID=A0A5B7K7H1_PORTR|nr:hypothetical protein [Portunus trituberculatus]
MNLCHIFRVTHIFFAVPDHPGPIPINSPKEFRPLYSVWVVGVASLLVVMLVMVAFWRRKSLCAWIRNRHREKKPGQVREQVKRWLGEHEMAW